MKAPSYRLLLLALPLYIQQLSVDCCQFGDGCAYPCHCKDDDACNSDTGDCPNGCADGHPTGYGWGGPGCQVGNIAYEKTASQSGSRDDVEENVAAMFAVDGDLNQDYPSGSARCAWAYLSAQAWWKVNFNDLYVMYNVTVFNSHNGSDYLHETLVEYQVPDRSGYTRIGVIRAPTGGRVGVETLLRSTNTSVRTLRLIRTNIDGVHDNNLVVCEVVVYGFLYRVCTPGKFGPGCLLSCQCDTGTCRDTDGDCPSGCAAGKMGYGCQEDCPDGTWGLRCGTRCQCNDEGEVCTPDHGVCLISGCPAGQIGGDCTWLARKYNLTVRVLEASTESVELEITNIETTDENIELDIHIIQWSSDDASTWNVAGRLEDVVHGSYTYTVENLQPGEVYVFRVVPGQNLTGVLYYGLPSPHTSPVITVKPNNVLVGIIAGSVVGVLLIIAIIVIVVILCLRKRSKKAEKSALDGNQVNNIEAGMRSNATNGIQVNSTETGAVGDDLYENTRAPTEENGYLALAGPVASNTAEANNPNTSEEKKEKKKEEKTRSRGLSNLGNELKRALSRKNNQGLEKRKQEKEKEDGKRKEIHAARSEPSHVEQHSTEGRDERAIGSEKEIRQKEKPAKAAKPKQVKTARKENAQESEQKGGVLGGQTPNNGGEGRRTATSKSSPTVESLPVESASSDTTPVLPDKSPINVETTGAAIYQNQEQIYVNTSISAPVKIADLPSYTAHIKNTPSGFDTEFKLLPAGQTSSWTVAKFPKNSEKSRFANIHAYDHSRVKLDVEAGQSDYINASYIPTYDGKSRGYIAAQGPTEGLTVDFWKMMWQQNSNMIVMLTKLEESGKTKCERYWPEEGQLIAGEFTLSLIDFERFADYSISTLSAKREGEREHRIVRHFHFTGWPDHGVPAIATSLLELRRRIRTLDSQRTGPLVVHCSAGVGRTGTFLALDSLLNQADQESKVDVLGYINLMRVNRISMVQTVTQYVFIYDSLVEAVQSINCIIPCSDVKTAYPRLLKWRKSQESILAHQFQVLEVLKPARTNADPDGLQPENQEKNLSNDIIPGDGDRPYLQTHVVGTTNYINAVFVKGYRRVDSYLVTQTPLANTGCDLWRMVWEQGVSTIVMMSEVGTQPQVYWPEDDKTPLHIGPLKISLKSTKEVPLKHSDETFTTREFFISEQGKETPREVTQYVIRVPPQSYPEDNLVAKADITFPIQSCLEVMDLSEWWQMQTGNGPITVHCRDGVELSGLFCAANFVIEKLKVDQEIDVFNTVKQVRLPRPQLIPNLMQYRILHECAISYMQQHDAYANFT